MADLDKTYRGSLMIMHNSMSGILISVKPQFALAILNGTKTIELRRKFPLDLQPDTRLVIYASSPISKLVGECQIKEVIRLPVDDLWNLSCVDAMISFEGFKNYFRECEFGYAIHLCKTKRYHLPKPLQASCDKKVRPPQSYMYLNREIEL